MYSIYLCINIYIYMHYNGCLWLHRYNVSPLVMFVNLQTPWILVISYKYHNKPYIMGVICANLAIIDSRSAINPI
jgi:hypothetical protein